MEMGVALTRVDLERVWEVVFCQWWHLHISFQRSWPLPGKQSTWLSAGHSQEAAVKSQAYPMMSSAYPTPVSKYYITCRLNITSLWANHHWPVGVKHWLRPHRFSLDNKTNMMLTDFTTCYLHFFWNRATSLPVIRPRGSISHVSFPQKKKPSKINLGPPSRLTQCVRVYRPYGLFFFVGNMVAYLRALHQVTISYSATAAATAAYSRKKKTMRIDFLRVVLLLYKKTFLLSISHAEPRFRVS